MERLPRKIYNFEFKMEAVRLVEPGQSIAEAARSLGAVEQTLLNWIKAHKDGKRTIKAADRSRLLNRLRSDSNVQKLPGRWIATFWEKRRHTSRGAQEEGGPDLSQPSPVA